MKKTPAPPAAAKLAVALRERREALEQQTATAAILNVIGKSPSDVQPVFAAIAQNAMRLLGGFSAAVTRRAGDVLHLAAHTMVGKAGDEALRKMFPAPVSSRDIIGWVVENRKPTYVANTDTDARFSRGFREMARTRGFRSVIAVPMMLGREVIGTVSVARREPGTFTNREIGLLRTFAAQAVIAVENARLFNETKEALEHQKASADILRIVASSVESTDPVFEAITSAAMRLLPSVRVSLVMVRDGQIHYSSHSGVSDVRRAELARFFPMPLDRKSVVGHSILDKRVLHIPDIATLDRRYERTRKTGRISGWRALLVVPMIRDETAVGALGLSRESVGQFTEKQIALAQTFADQAVIAIRNASFFREIQDRNTELKQSLDFQGASGEILASISSSVTDTKPVFVAIAKNTRRLLDTSFVAVSLLRQNQLELVAAAGDDAYLARVRAAYPWSLEGDDGALAKRAVRGGKVVHLCPIHAESGAPPKVKRLAKAAGYDSILLVPMLREGAAIGLIATARQRAVPFDDRQIALIKAFADQAVIAIENARLFNETKEALERQTATADVLKVISRSPAKLQPVFEAVAQRAAKLSGVEHASVFLADGAMLKRMASSETFTGLQEFPIRRTLVNGRAFLDRRAVHVPDILPVLDAEYPDAREMQRSIGWRSIVAVPLLLKGQAIGTINAWRREPRAFSKEEIALLQTFADQAVIAIENARLFNETKEALSQQTATGEILKVISSSPTDEQPVFDAIVQSAARLFGRRSRIRMLEGDVLRLRARSDAAVEASSEADLLIDRDSTGGQVFLERTPLQVADTLSTDAPPYARRRGHKLGYRAIAVAPLVREEKVIGLISVTSPAPGLLTEKHMSLLTTFADQAVIAIENVRLFRELQTRNKDLTEALEQQTATGDILKVISSSPTDVKPVFETIARNSVRLCNGRFGALFTFDGKMMDVGAMVQPDPEARRMFLQAFPQPITPTTPSAIAILERRVVNVPDILTENYSEDVKERARTGCYRSVLTVPMMRGDTPIGAIAITRPEAEAFGDAYVALLKTFADQAVIAIENVRLFNETKEALERQTATAEILEVMSGSPTDVQPVFDAIARSGLRLFGVAHVGVTLRDGDSILSKATAGSADPRGEFRIPLNRDSTAGRAILDRRLVNIPDTEAPDAPGFARESGQIVGFRAIAAAPMLREGAAIGSVHMMRKTPGVFSAAQLELLKTFADQAVIAIENVRLFNETKESLDQQTAISEVLRVISSSPTDVKPVLEAVAARAARICDATDARIMLVEADKLRNAAGFGDVPITIKLGDSMPLDRGSVIGRAVVDRVPVHVEDYATLSRDEYPLGRELAARSGYRTVLAVPLLREDLALGAITLRRIEARPFTERQIALLKTFADQAAIAIENVRLFNETKEALEQQTATAEILKVISSSPTDTGPVLEAIVQSAARLFDPRSTAVVMRDGDQMVLHAVAGPLSSGPKLDALRKLFPIPYDTERYSAARAIAERRIIEIEDAQGAGAPEQGFRVAQAMGYRSLTLVPLVREGLGIGLIALIHPDPGYKLEAKQLELVKTFADQAVIAIENVRLFNETKEGLERQTATAEILRVISGSPADVQPVFNAIVNSAVRLIGGYSSVVTRMMDGQLHLAAFTSINEAADGVLKSLFPMVITGDSPIAEVIRSKSVLFVPDTETDPRETAKGRENARARGYRSILHAPMLRGDVVIGVIHVTRVEPGSYTDREVELLKTFADQAVIAIENVRLFREIEEKSAQLEVANQHKSEFLANMSHELRTPLNAIIGFSEVLTEKMFGEVNEKQLDYLKDIHESGRHLLSLINDILDLSKIEAGRMELELASFHLPTAISNAMTLVRERAQRHGIRLGEEIDAGLGEFTADERKVKQILVNLLSNAVKFTPDGGRVDVRAAMNGKSVEIAVQDTGIGIAPEDQELLFEEFKQVGRDSGRKAEGTGLGLALTKRFVELHGGEIRVDSAPGKGSTFTVVLPLR